MAKFYVDRTMVTHHSGLNARRVTKDVGHVEGYISERLQDKASGAINN